MTRKKIIEHEPLPDGLAQLVPPHWCQSPTDLQLVDSLMHLSPSWLPEILGPLSKLYRPLRFGLPNLQFRNSEEFAKGGASLACLINLSDTAYEVFAVDFPPPCVVGYGKLGACVQGPRDFPGRWRDQVIQTM